MYKPDYIAELLEHFQKQTPLRASSLVISVWGDAVEPHGGAVWLGSLINLMEPFGINERLMRTSIFRLTQDDWLVGNKVGRRSYYSLSDSGKQRFEDAFRTVYNPDPQEWSGRWVMAITQLLTPDERKQLHDALRSSGFGSFGNSMLASPRASLSQTHDRIERLGLSDRVALFEAEHQAAFSEQAVRALVSENWNLSGLADHYNEFIELFRPLWPLLDGKQTIDPESAFIARTLLIHEYRKSVLRDPILPQELLPDAWPGQVARQLCRNLYLKLSPDAEKWLLHQLETIDGPVPELLPHFFKRFGGVRI